MVSSTRNPESRVLVINEVSERLQISPRTLRRLVATGRFPAGRRIGPRLLRWTEEDVRAFLDRSKQHVAG
jgi:excisionase family DNA binding protein